MSIGDISLEDVVSLVKRTDDSVKKCQKKYGKHDHRCQKSTGSQTLPIVLGVCIPVVIAIIALIALHFRHVKKLKKEEAENQDIDVDMDMDFDESVEYKNGSAPYWGRANNNSKTNHSAVELSEQEMLGEKYLEHPGTSAIRNTPRSGSMTGSFTSSNHPENPFYSNAPYLMPPELTGSNVSLEEYSKTLNSIYDSSAARPYPNSNSLYSAPGLASSSASLNAGMYSATSSKANSITRFHSPPPSIHSNMPRSTSKTQLSKEESVSNLSARNPAQASTTDLHTVTTNPDQESIAGASRTDFRDARESRESLVSESEASFVSADSQIMHSAVNLTSAMSSTTSHQQRLAQNNMNNHSLSNLVHSVSHGQDSTLHGQMISEDEDELTENELTENEDGSGSTQVPGHVHNYSITSQGNAKVRENVTGTYGQSQTALLQQASEVDLYKAPGTAASSRPLSYRHVSNEEEDHQKNFSFEQSHDESADENSLDTTNATSTNETSQDFSFDKNDEPEGELNRNDTKRFERMKSIYREYMPDGEDFDDEAVPPLPRQSVKSTDTFDRELNHEIEKQHHATTATATKTVPSSRLSTAYDPRFSFVDSVNEDVGTGEEEEEQQQQDVAAVAKDITRSSIIEEPVSKVEHQEIVSKDLPVNDEMDQHVTEHVTEHASEQVPRPVASTDEPEVPSPVHAFTPESYQHESFYDNGEGYDQNSDYIQPPVRYSLYQESVYDNASIRDDQTVYSSTYPANNGGYQNGGYQNGNYANANGNGTYPRQNTMPLRTSNNWNAANGGGLYNPRQRPQQSMGHPAAAGQPMVSLPQKAPRPLQKLKTLPNPSKVSDDLMFAPQQRRKPTGPKDIIIPHSPSQSPMVDGHSPITSPVLPSPSGFRGSVITDNLDFAPPKKYVNSPTISHSGSFGHNSRSNSMGTTASSPYNSPMSPNGFHPNNGQQQARGSIRPDSMLVPGLDDSKMLKPQMDMTS